MASDIVAMRRVSAYRTTDDQLHDDRDKAVRHQAHIDLTAWIKDETAELLNTEAAKDLAHAMIDADEHIAQLLRRANKGLS